MKHEIDMKNYNIHTDLVLDTIEDNSTNIKTDIYEKDNIKVTSIEVDSNNSKILNKKEGKYITIEFDDVTDENNRKSLENILICEIKKMINSLNLKDNYEVLVIGLGNDKSTPDSLGPKVINNILVTRHLSILGQELAKGIRKVSALTPKVMADTGIESSDIISSVVSSINPSLVIVVDALCASSISRVNKTIQITNTGIHPGSGIGNNRKEISTTTLNIPVIAVGVPTVVSSSVIVNDTINYLFKHISYIKENQSINKLIFNRTKYKDKIKDKELSNEEKVNLLGLIGGLSEEEQKNLIDEVLNSLEYNFIVTPKEIDFIIDKLSEVLSYGINNSIHDIKV